MLGKSAVLGAVGAVGPKLPLAVFRGVLHWQYFSETSVEQI